MQVTSRAHPEGALFTLTAECTQDQAFIDALHLHNHVGIHGFERTPSLSSRGEVHEAVRLLVGQTAMALRAKAGREFAGAFGNLMRLSLGDAASHGHIGADATDPQFQEQLTASLEKLQLMVQALGEVVGQQGAVLKEMVRAHGSSIVKIHIVDQEEGTA